jgi:hypothetical protein
LQLPSVEQALTLLNSQRRVGIGCASAAAFVSSAKAGRLAAIETAAAATSLNIVVIKISPLAPGEWRQLDSIWMMTLAAGA